MSKVSKNKPAIKKGKSSKSKITTSDRSKIIVNGFIRVTWKRSPRLVNRIMPQDIINIIFAFVTFRDYISIALLGHVDSGKSTLGGVLLHNLGVISDKELKIYQNDARDLGKESFGYAFCLDRSKGERERGITIHGSMRYQFMVGSYKYALIDCPGHRDFLKNTLSHLAMVDAAIFVISAAEREFEVSIAKGNHRRGEREGIMRIHAQLCYIFGVEKIIVVFNKMDLLKEKRLNPDAVEIKSHQRYIYCKNVVHKILTKIGFKTKRIVYIPISAINNENITKFCVNKSYLKWYKGFKIKRKKNEYIQGFTLFDALKDVIEPNNRLFMEGINKPFKMSVLNKYYIRRGNIADVFQGRIICGALKTGDKLKCLSIKRPLIVRSIQKNYNNIYSEECGAIVSLNVRLDNDDRRVIGSRPRLLLYSMKDNVQYCETFRALIFVKHSIGRLHVAKLQKVNIKTAEKYVGGYTPPIFVSTWRSPCKLIKIKWKKMKNKNKIKNAEYMEQGDIGEVTFKALKPFIVYKYENIKSYGRIVVVDNFKIVLFGKVLKVKHKK